MLSKKAGAYEVEVLYGKLSLKKVCLPQAGAVSMVTLSGDPIVFSFKDGFVDLGDGVCIDTGMKLQISYV